MRSIGKEQLQYKPDISEVKNQKARAEKYRFYKIPTAFFSSTDKSSEIHTEYEKAAIKFIENDLEIPKDLENKLIETMSEREERNKKYNIVIWD